MIHPNTLSLFTGAGGLDLGFENAGFRILAANEQDHNAATTYIDNHPEVHFFEGDIQKVKPELCSVPNVDVIIGGPPCQGFSVAGKMDMNDPRNKMVWHFMDVVENVRPRAFVIENVKALFSLNKWRPIREKIISQANKFGYSIIPILLNAVDFGVPQKRFRVFFLAFRDVTLSESELKLRFESYHQKAPTVRQALSILPRAGQLGNPLTSTAKITFATNPILRKSPYAGMLFNGAGRPVDIDGQANTLPASMGGNKTPIIDESTLYNGRKNFVESYRKKLSDGFQPKFSDTVPHNLRRMTVKEAQIIQTFPKDFIFEGPMSSQYRQIGNAVPPALAQVVAKVVLDILEHNSVNSMPLSGPTQLSIL